jgi:hypothetical protein
MGPIAETSRWQSQTPVLDDMRESGQAQPSRPHRGASDSASALVHWPSKRTNRSPARTCHRNCESRADFPYVLKAAASPPAFPSPARPVQQASCASNTERRLTCRLLTHCPSSLLTDRRTALSHATHRSGMHGVEREPLIAVVTLGSVAELSTESSHRDIKGFG